MGMGEVWRGWRGRVRGGECKSERERGRKRERERERESERERERERESERERKERERERQNEKEHNSNDTWSRCNFPIARPQIPLTMLLAFCDNVFYDVSVEVMISK